MDSIKTDLAEIWSGMDWMGLSQDRDKWMALMKVIINFRVPKSAGNFLNGYTSGSFSSRY
jgi:hypothetical protein